MLTEWGALLVGVGAVLSGSTAALVAWHGARRMNTKVDTVIQAVNHVDEEVTENGQATLGQRVKAIQTRVELGFAENERAHMDMHRRMTQIESERG